MQFILFYDLQIAGRKQEAVDRCRIIPDFGIDNRGVHIRGNHLSLHQFAEIVCSLIVCLRNDLSDDAVISRGLPIGFCRAILIHIIENGPGIENVRIAKAIAVIPLADLLILIRSAVILHDVSDLVFGKAEIFTVAVFENGVYLQVVETAENAFLCHTKNAS